MKKRILSALTALALCLTLLPATALAADGESSTEPHTHSNWLASDYGTDAKTLVLRAGGPTNTYGDPVQPDSSVDGWLLEEGAYYLKDAVTIDKPIVIRKKVTICLNGKTIESSAKDQPVFEVTSGSTLTLTDCQNNKGKVKHTGDGSGSGVRVEGSGTFNMYGGTITGNKAETGGGVYVYGGTFTMSGGTISGNTADSTDGGVGVYSGAKFIMNGGEITGNTAHSFSGGVGVYTSATFEMNGGTIGGTNDSKANKATNGGGVRVGNYGVFTMSGGSIADNTATENGGGVYVSGTNSAFNMTGGTISGNTTTKGDGGGVYVNEGKFEMSGGTIGVTDNGAANTAKNGGGVYVEERGTFNMNNTASVTGNTASASGGVYVNSGKFNMNDGEITGNTANQGNGGGVYVNDGGTFTMNDGAIKSNETANDDAYGGGVYVSGTNSTFEMNGTASITDNMAPNGGGGVYVNSGEFNMNGNASITGNTASGVFVSAAAFFTVSGEPTVIGNTRNSAPSNVFLAGDKTITIGKKGLSDKASIGVTRGAYLVIANDVNEDYSGNFSSDKTQYVVKYDNKQLVLAEKSGGTTNPPVTTEHKHFLCGGKTACNEVGGHSCEATTFATKLWMDGGVLKKGNDVWKKGTVKRADSVNDSSEGYVLTAGNYYLENDLTLSGAAILIDGDVKLCLNGHTIDRANGNAALDYVIRVLGKNKAHLTLTDCVGGGKLTGGKYGGVDIFGFCTLDMFGGTITGNEFNGGVDVGQFGEFNMYGGKITGNSAEYGGGVYTYGKFTMSGGSITNNTATKKGGGVLVDGGTFTVSGNVNITNNTVGGKTNNVYLSEGKTIAIGTGGLSGTIGVTTEPKPAAGKPVTVIAATKGISGLTTHVVSDDNAYATAVEGSAIVLKVVGDGGETPPPVLVSKITLNTTTATLEVGKTTTLTATVEPSDATNKDVTWTSSNENVATVTANGTVTAKAPGTTTITATAEGGTGKFATCTVTVTGGTTPSQPGGSTGGNTGGSSSSGGSSSDRDSSDSNPVIKTETKNNTDGSTTKTETRKDGSVTQTTTGKDGSVSKTETKKDGSSVTENKAANGSTGTVKTDKHGQTEAKTALSNKAIEDAKKNGEAVKAPVEVKASHDSSTAPTVKVELPKGAGETKVEIPVSNVKSGTVAVLVHPDGTEEILKNSIPTEDGIQLTVDGNATVKIIDNSKDFIDTRNHWAREEIDFVSARELVNGMSDTIYAPNASATRAQLWTILARQNDADLSGGANWYEKAQLWSKDKGISDGTEPNAAINRAQMVTMLWRTMGQPAAGGAANFNDVPANSYYAQAVAWAIENGITAGVGNGKFDPDAACTRGQIATFLYNYTARQGAL